jgi:hypothetical protein
MFLRVKAREPFSFSDSDWRASFYVFTRSNDHIILGFLNGKVHEEKGENNKDNCLNFGRKNL